MLTKNPCSKIYDFEASDNYIYYKFLDVLKQFRILPLQEYVVPYCDSSSCRFCCTRKERLEIEYIFRRLIGLDGRYLLDLESYQDRARRYQEERYAIY